VKESEEGLVKDDDDGGKTSFEGEGQGPVCRNCTALNISASNPRTVSVLKHTAFDSFLQDF
jgi:hypothetical protein